MKQKLIKPTGFYDRNQNEISTGDICKYKKVVCGGDFIFVAIKRTYQGKTEYGLHRQGFYEPECAGCCRDKSANTLSSAGSGWDSRTEG